MWGLNLILRALLRDFNSIIPYFGKFYLTLANFTEAYYHVNPLPGLLAGLGRGHCKGPGTQASLASL